MDPQEELFMLTYGPWKFQIVYVAAKLGIADAIDHGAKSSQELANLIGANASILNRVLPILSSHLS